MRSYTRGAFLALALLGAASFFLSGCDEKQPAQQHFASVTYMRIEPAAVTLTTELPGRTSAYMISEVRPQVSGIIQERFFVEGSDVTQGDVLYQIDPSLYQAAYDNAKAALMKAEANKVAASLLAGRYKKVVKVNAVSKQEYDNAVAAQGQANAEVAAARAALDTARINLEYTKVIAPISGRIGRSSVTPGALVTQNQITPLATIQQLDPMYVDVTQSSTDLLRLKRAFASGALTSSGERAMQATLKLEDGTTYAREALGTNAPRVREHGAEDTPQNAQPVIGILKFSEVTVDQGTGAVTIRAVFPNPDGTLLPGMYVRAVLEEGVSENAILIPQKAVIRNNRGQPVAQVLIKNDSVQGQEDLYIPEPRILTVDRAIGNRWLVTDGLKQGELVLVTGLQKVRAGTPVKGEPEAALSANSFDGNAPGTGPGGNR